MTSNLDSPPNKLNRHLADVLRPLPLMASLTAASLLVLYLLGLARVFEIVGWQMLAVAAVLALVAMASAVIRGRLIAGRRIAGYPLYAGLTCCAAIILTVLWQGVAPAAILMAWIAPLTCLGAPVPRRQRTFSLAASGIVTVVVLWSAFQPWPWQMSSNSPAGFAALLLLVSMLALFALVVLTTQVIRYRSLQARLVGSLLPIVAIPIIFTTSVSAYSAVTSSQQQLGSTLQAVASLKRGQLDTLVQGIFGELASMQNQAGDMTSIQHVLDRTGESDEDYRLNASIAATQIRDLIVAHPTSDYEEVLVLDRQGQVVLSTYLLNQGQSYADEGFFQQGLASPTAQFIRYPGQQNPAGDFKLVSAAPFYAGPQGQVLGVVVAASSGDLVTGILGPTPGLTESTSYLVDQEYRPASNMTSAGSLVRTAAITSIIAHQSGSGTGVYVNYNATPVLGYYEWDPVLRGAIVAEIPLTVLLSRSLGAVLASAVVGLLTLIIAGMAVTATSRGISSPVGALAGIAERLAGGDLGARAESNRQDEIGRLSRSFDSMAGELQSMIRDLEARVGARTRDLESQIDRLRTAADVARETMLAPSLGKLLEIAATTVMDRFGLDHVAIWLLDDQKEFAVLQAAPSAAGVRMLEDRLRVRVGDPGPIGQAASTREVVAVQGEEAGEGQMGDVQPDAAASEMALPMRGGEGLIGVLDLQSGRAGAFRPGDREIMQVLADQLAAAIERSRLLLRIQGQLTQAEQTYRTFAQDAWSGRAKGAERTLGYRYDGVRLDPVSQVAESGSATQDAGPRGADLVIPIRLRDRELGSIRVDFGENAPPAVTQDMLQEAARRLATALENVQLLEDSVKRASKERQIGEITAKIGGSINMRNILQTAAEELGRVLPGSDVTIKLGTAPTAAKEDSRR